MDVWMLDELFKTALAGLQSSRYLCTKRLENRETIRLGEKVPSCQSWYILHFEDLSSWYRNLTSIQGWATSRCKLPNRTLPIELLDMAVLVVL